MKRVTLSILTTGLLAFWCTPSSIAQNKAEDAIAKNDTTKIAQKAGGTTNMMLNASADNGPRVVNIGLPASVGGTVILENGLPVVYDYMGQMPTSVWRQDYGISRFEVLNLSQTALRASDVGVSVSTWTNRGTSIMKGTAGFTTNSFGLLRGDVNISGPMKNGWYYSATAFVNLDPGTFHSNISTFLDKTQIYKMVINKKYRTGQIGVQYKFANSEAINIMRSPYIYHEDGTVSKFPGFRIGRDSYLEQSGKIHTIDPLTGENVSWDAMKDGGSTSHVIDIMGDQKIGRGLLLDYTVRFQHANTGVYNPFITAITSSVNPNTPESELKQGDKRYFYADNPSAPYEGYVQNGMMLFAPKSKKTTLMARFELSKKTMNHHWMIGLHNWYYKTNKSTGATYSYQYEVVPNPRALLYDEWITDKAGNGQWVRKTDSYGNRNHNAAMQYGNGIDNKMAFIAADTWKINNKFTVDAGTRIEWQRIDGDWYTEEDRKSAGTNWISGKTTDVKKDWFNFSVTASATWKAFRNFGFLADAFYLQESGKLSLYAGADDPHVSKCEIPGFAAGIYFNHPMISFVSKVTSIKRTNFKTSATFNEPTTGEPERKTISYDVSTIGWTTDLLLRPFKGFDLHLLLTLQNPKYKNYEFTTSWGQEVNNNNNVARSVSKTLIEIDPSYTFGKFKIWGSARYFSKQYANYTNTLIFGNRWETFAGLNYKYDKNIEFGVSVVNLLNESGAQGTISGTNTTTAEEAIALYDKPLGGTYIRPFTVEFKTVIKF